MRAGRPPFVLSDAFPGDLLPIPSILRLGEVPVGVDVKAFKRAKWISSGDFRKACLGDPLPRDAYLPDPTLCEVSRHNALSRTSGGSLESGGLFGRTDTTLTRDTQTLTVYFRSIDEPSTELLFDLMHELSLTGFGADIATGRGQFDIVEDPSIAIELDQAVPEANGVVVLSTCQPAPSDTTHGCWETFPKFGKVGPGLGLTDVRKNTLVMLRPGACFVSSTNRSFFGHAIPMDRILRREAHEVLKSQAIEIVHSAFGLTVPARLDLDLLQ